MFHAQGLANRLRQIYIIFLLRPLPPDVRFALPRPKSTHQDQPDPWQSLPNSICGSTRAITHFFVTGQTNFAV